MLSKITVVAAALAGISSAQTPSSCEYYYDGYLAVRSSASEDAPHTYVGFIPGVTARGLDGHADPLLVTHYKNGSALAPQIFEFLHCSDLDNHPNPPGYQVPDTGPTNDYFGIIRPKGQTSRCLSLTSKNDNSTGAINAIVNAANCTSVEERYRSFFIEDYIYGDSDYGMRVFYANADDTALIANTTHKEVVFKTNDKGSDSNAMQMVLLPDYD